MSTTNKPNRAREPEPQVSIIIPNWNGGTELSECVESILSQTHGVSLELIIIDNGSTDQSREAVERFAARDPRVTTIFNSENRFFAGACNQGYEKSRGRYILIANNDILLIDEAVTALVEYAEEHPEAGVVTPVFIGRDGQPQQFVRRLPNAFHVIAHYHRLGRVIDRVILGRHFQNHYFYRDRSFDGVEEIEQAGASFSLIRRELIEELGFLFDERFPLLFNDVDLYKRIQQAGAISLVVGDIRVVHLGGVSSRKFDAARYQRFQDRGMFRYFKKHHPMQYGLLVLAWPVRWSRTIRRRNAVARW